MHYRYADKRINQMLDDTTSDIEIHFEPFQFRYTVGDEYTVRMAPNQTIHDVFSTLNALLIRDGTYQKNQLSESARPYPFAPWFDYDGKLVLMTEGGRVYGNSEYERDTVYDLLVSTNSIVTGSVYSSMCPPERKFQRYFIMYYSLKREDRRCRPNG